jgi:hypothetical protein
MTSRKTLKSVSHSFGHSMVGMMNYMHDDYFLGHLLKQSRKTNLDKLEIDLLKKSIKPEGLLTVKINTVIERRIEWFPKLVESNDSSMEFIKSALLTIKFDLETTRPYPENPQYIENPYVCEVVIVDDRGKEYRRKQEGWWFPET